MTRACIYAIVDNFLFLFCLILIAFIIPVRPNCFWTYDSLSSGFLKSRRDRRKEKKVSKKKRDSDASSVKSDGEPNSSSIGAGQMETSSLSSSVAGVLTAPSAKDDGFHSALGADATVSDSVRIDEEGYTIRPKDDAWTGEKTSGFYSSSDADSGTINLALFERKTKQKRLSLLKVFCLKTFDSWSSCFALFFFYAPPTRWWAWKETARGNQAHH